MNKNDGLFADFVKKSTYFVVAHTELNLLRVHPQAWLWNPNVALGIRSSCWFVLTRLLLFWTLILWGFHSSLELSVTCATVTQNGESRDLIFTLQNMVYGQNLGFLFYSSMCLEPSAMEWQWSPTFSTLHEAGEVWGPQPGQRGDHEGNALPLPFPALERWGRSGINSWKRRIMDISGCKGWNGVLGVNLALVLLYESTGFVAMTYKQPSQAASPSSLLSSFLCPHPVLTESRSQLLLPLHNILTSSLTQLVNVESFSY